jgi:hypothetical protein
VTHNMKWIEGHRSLNGCAQFEQLATDICK